ncbi:hypothetical protein P3T76_013797 [Phytophthora citrophthora]|uniref:Uncharacterized protein n=1 Tax=Phytophthora citrophthora TaxID=4793 RepID=A0AAD9G317_9STRA|nr:hypothetical protein P3T76_013797 [Phytophthora citrophthora]
MQASLSVDEMEFPRLRKRKYAQEAEDLAKKAQALRQELAELKKSSDKQQLALASVQSMIFDHLGTQCKNPMHTNIHLPRDRSARRNLLLNRKSDNIRQCYDYLKARSNELDLLKNHFSGDSFEDPDGNFVGRRFDVIRFHGTRSLKQTYDALARFMCSLEGSDSTLGDLTGRDDYQTLHDDTYISNHRFESNHEGVRSEVNTTTFAQYFEDQNELEDLKCAVLITDSVDEDDLHSYDPLTFVRRDVTAGIVLTEEQNCGEVVVLMRHAAFMKVYRPSFDVPDEVVNEMYEQTAQWPATMVQTIRRFI